MEEISLESHRDIARAYDNSLAARDGQIAVEVPEFAHLLICPACSGSLFWAGGSTRCAGCGQIYPRNDARPQADLRLRSDKHHSVCYRPRFGQDRNVDVDLSIPVDPTSAVDWRAGGPLATEIRYGNRFVAEMLSYFPQARSDADWMLDLGCGDRRFEEICVRHTRLRYIGVDYDGDRPHLLADAHALPFQDQAFSLVISVAVLEHLTFPDIAMAEIFRVLRPGGIFVGTVAFLEPFHMDSHFHMTHLGLARVLEQSGLEIVTIAPNPEWDGLRAQAEMALYPGLNPVLQRALVALPRGASNAWAGMKQLLGRAASERSLTNVLATTGGFRFVARRPPVAHDEQREFSYVELECRAGQDR